MNLTNVDGCYSVLYTKGNESQFKCYGLKKNFTEDIKKYKNMGYGIQIYEYKEFFKNIVDEEEL